MLVVVVGDRLDKLFQFGSFDILLVFYEDCASQTAIEVLDYINGVFLQDTIPEIAGLLLLLDQDHFVVGD